MAAKLRERSEGHSLLIRAFDVEQTDSVSFKYVW